MYCKIIESPFLTQLIFLLGQPHYAFVFLPPNSSFYFSSCWCWHLPQNLSLSSGWWGGLLWRQTARGDWLMGEDREGTNVTEGQTGLPVSGTVKSVGMVIDEESVCVCVCILSMWWRPINMRFYVVILQTSLYGVFSVSLSLSLSFSMCIPGHAHTKCVLVGTYWSMYCLCQHLSPSVGGGCVFVHIHILPNYWSPWEPTKQVSWERSNQG